MSNFTGGSIPGTKKYKKDQVKAKKNPIKQGDSAAKKAWLKKTRNSPAAKAGFSDEQRWELQKKHRARQEARKSGKKTTTKSSTTKSSTTKSSTTKSSTKNSGFFSKKEPIKNLGKNTKVTSSKGKTTYETSTKAKGLAGFFGKKNKKKISIPTLANLK